MPHDLMLPGIIPGRGEVELCGPGLCVFPPSGSGQRHVTSGGSLRIIYSTVEKSRDQPVSNAPHSNGVSERSFLQP